MQEYEASCSPVQWEFPHPLQINLHSQPYALLLHTRIINDNSTGCQQSAESTFGRNSRKTVFFITVQSSCLSKLQAAPQNGPLLFWLWSHPRGQKQQTGLVDPYGVQFGQTVSGSRMSFFLAEVENLPQVLLYWGNLEPCQRGVLGSVFIVHSSWSQ